jgi:lysophospholipase L1-like esterase
MGDSLTASYAGAPYGAAGDRSWTDQLQALRAGEISIINEAVPGATSSSLLSGGQASALADLVRHHAIDYAVLMVGANDITANLPTILAGNPQPFVSTVVANIETAVDTVADAGHVKLVVSNIPDVSITPGFQFFISSLGLPASVLPEVTTAVQMANTQIATFATAHDIPLVDLNGLAHLTLSPLTVGGVTIPGNKLYAPDGFHPSTVGQGLIANTILAALGVASHAPAIHAPGLRLSDQEILTEAAISHSPGRTAFDVQPYVIFHKEHWEHRRECWVGETSAQAATLSAHIGEPTDPLDAIFERLANCTTEA